MYAYKITLDIQVSTHMNSMTLFATSFSLAVMMAAVIDITNDEQKQTVRRLCRESGNVNVKTTMVRFHLNVTEKTTRQL